MAKRISAFRGAGRSTQRRVGYRLGIWTWVLVCAVAGTVTAQHDVHRNSVRKIAAGDLQAAESMLEPVPDDPETLYLKSWMAALREQPDESLAAARRAVQAGLPIERFVAGPRDAFQPLAAHPDFRRWADQQASPLLHGPLLGCVTDRSAAFWVRTASALPVRAVVRAAEAETVEIASDSQTQADADYTAILRVDGLQPLTEYTYQVLVDGRPMLDPQPRFRTAPPPSQAARFTIAFGGGAGYVPEHESMWDTIRERSPHALLMLGDNVYIDDPTQPWTQHYCYYRRQSRPEWRQLTARTAVYAIYDDHDFGTDDCIPGAEVDEPPWKRDVWRRFQQNWVNPAYGGGEAQPGCWYDFSIGDVHFIMLDGRYYRSRSGTPSMLGPAQKAWLLETLKNSRGTFKVLASPVPWSEGVKPGSKDPWDGFPEEREEIFRFIEQQRIEGVVLIAADRHRSDLRITRRENGYDLYEFESSRLTNRHTHSVVQTPGLVFGYSKTCSVGMMHFDTTQADPEVRCEIVDIDGRSVHSATILRSQLRFKDR
ncbi:MAG: alkaline phosphatase D family protein [Pirellulaceae bacterium]|nr:alkaline phosphatase D family protein [Pirellulaceae bacterium]